MPYFEDYEPGRERELGTFSLSEDEIIAFAEKFDPQRIHTDVVFATDGPYGGLIASGWQTAVMAFSFVASEYLDWRSSMGGPAVDELRFHQPVRPNELLAVRVRILDARRSASKSDRGIVRTLISVTTSTGDLVYSAISVNIIRRRTTHDRS